MILSVDVYYQNSRASVAGVSFLNWEDSDADGIFRTVLDPVAEYQPGQFYLRELPCILKLIEEHDLHPDVVIVDGYVYLDGHHRPGLGKHLFDALGGKVVVVGVAKRHFQGVPAEYEVFRGGSRRPLYVTSAGMPLEAAKAAVLSLHGKYRVPTLLKKADQLCRQGLAG
ncbi:endonuclease V [Geomesophilobacter sediminis]|nr:endonuclease V [Geomesophilobacter sediminis]